MPLMPARIGSRVSTRWRMFVVRSCSPAEMKILVPDILVGALARRLALCAIRPSNRCRNSAR